MKRIVAVILIGVMLMSFVACQSQTPYIGENGNWWIGNDDLGVAAQGPQGEPGPRGEQGPQGEPDHHGDQPFVSGEKVACHFGESFEMNIMGTEDTAQIQRFSVVKNREADFNNLADYWHVNSSYYYYKRFIYDVYIEGKVDAKYAGQKICLIACFANDDVTWTENGDEYWGIISSDGTFIMEFQVHDNQNETYVIPQHIYITPIYL